MYQNTEAKSKANSFVKISNNMSFQMNVTQLGFIDPYVYYVLRSSMDFKKLTTTISLKGLSAKCDLAINTVRTSLQRLQEKRYIQFSATANVLTTYKFQSVDKDFSRVPYVLLLDKNLEPKEKAYLILIHQYLFEGEIKLELWDNKSTYFSPTKLSSLIGISKDTCLAHTKTLSDKGYITKIVEPGMNTKRDARWEINFRKLYESSNIIIEELLKEKYELLKDQKSKDDLIKELQIENTKLKEQLKINNTTETESSDNLISNF